MKSSLCSVLIVMSFAALATPALAQKAKPKPATGAMVDPNDHPATKVVVTYLNHALRHEWPQATALITEKSLSNVHRGWVARVKNTALTIDDEMDMVRSIGKKSLTEVEEMADGEFYAAYHKALQKEFAMDEERLTQITNSLDVNVLSAGVEGDDLIHILVRTNHVDDDARVSNLELVSLRKTENGWRVSLTEQGPKLTPAETKK